MEYVLGIDLGTTTVKTVLYNCKTRAVEQSCERYHRADIENLPLSYSEQKVAHVLVSLEECMEEMVAENPARMESVKCIAVSGQMHGIVLWSNKFLDEPKNRGYFQAMNSLRQGSFPITNLITWQDQRTDNNFLSSLPFPDSHLTIHEGFGCASLFWLYRNQRDIFNLYNCSGTIADFLVTILCGLKKTVMSTQNAASWGYFNAEKMTWNVEILSQSGFPIDILPEIVNPETEAGHLHERWHGVPADTPVLCAMGDLQCSVFSQIRPSRAILNIGTSAQLVFQMPDNFVPKMLEPDSLISPVQFFPYFEHTFLAVAASLNGGNVLNRFIQILVEWCSKMTGARISIEQAWEKVISIMEQDSSQFERGDSNYGNHQLVIKGTYFGERHLPSSSSSSGMTVEGITPKTGFSLGSVFKSLIESIISNLNEMMPKSTFINNGIKELILLGQAEKWYMSKIIERLYSDTDIKILKGQENISGAALGCALVANRFLKKLT